MKTQDTEKLIAIERVNFWSSAPPVTSYVRKQYVDLINGYLGNPLIKVLVGQRRCGKSTLLKQIIHQLLACGIPAKNILFLNFELHELQWIKTQAVLIEAIELYIKTKKPTEKIYIFCAPRSAIVLAEGGFAEKVLTQHISYPALDSLAVMQ